MPIMEAVGVSKTCRAFQKRDGFLGARRGLYRRWYRP